MSSIVQNADLLSYHAFKLGDMLSPSPCVNAVFMRVSKAGGGAGSKDGLCSRSKVAGFEESAAIFNNYLKNHTELASLIRKNPRVPAPVPEIGDVGLFNIHGTYNACHNTLTMHDVLNDEDRFFGKVVYETERLIWIEDVHQTPVLGKHCYSKDYFGLGIISWEKYEEADVPEKRPPFEFLQLNNGDFKAVSARCQCVGRA